MKALITGADGFIGSHLTEGLVKAGYKVKALSYYNSFNYWGWLEKVDCKNEIEIVAGDIRDPEFCRKLTKNVDIIFHLAALIAIPYSYVAPNSYIETNVKGTLNLCQAAFENKIEKFIHTSTSEVYGTARYVPIDENHPLHPQSPYSASKIGADAIAMSFYHSFNLPLAILRPFNTYGPRQSSRAVIPTIITQIADGKKNINIGSLIPTRDLTFVKDTCRGFIQIAESDQTIGEVINLGSNSEISIEGLFDKIKVLMNSDVELNVENERIRPEKSEVFRLWCDNSKIKKLVGFQPEYTLEEGLKETISWFLEKENLRGYKTNIYNT
ncbi:MAG: NAD-dependent 4,6-dehydratase LegB [Bacteroidales bacterium]|jgi:NAD dependent epimerase/dehydratase